MLNTKALKSAFRCVAIAIALSMVSAEPVAAQSNGDEELAASEVPDPRGPVEQIRPALQEAIEGGDWAAVDVQVTHLFALWRPTTTVGQDGLVFSNAGGHPLEEHLPILLQFTDELLANETLDRIFSAPEAQPSTLSRLALVLNDSRIAASYVRTNEDAATLFGEGPAGVLSHYREQSGRLQTAEVRALEEHQIVYRIALAADSPDAGIVWDFARSYLSPYQLLVEPGSSARYFPAGDIQYLRLVDARRMLLDERTPLSLRAVIFQELIFCLINQDHLTRPPAHEHGDARVTRERARRSAEVDDVATLSRELRDRDVSLELLSRYGAVSAYTMVRDAVVGHAGAGPRVEDAPPTYPAFAPMIEYLSIVPELTVNDVEAGVVMLAGLMSASRITLGRVGANARGALVVLYASGDLGRVEANVREHLESEQTDELVSRRFLPTTGGDDPLEQIKDAARSTMPAILRSLPGHTVGLLAAMMSLPTYDRAIGIGDLLTLMQTSMPGFMVEEMLSRLVDGYIGGRLQGLEGVVADTLEENDFRAKPGVVVTEAGMSLSVYTDAVLANLSGPNRETAALDELTYLIENFGDHDDVIDRVLAALERDEFLSGFETRPSTSVGAENERERKLSVVRHVIERKRGKIGRSYALFAVLAEVLASDTSGRATELRAELEALLRAAVATPAGVAVISHFSHATDPRPVEGLAPGLVEAVQVHADGRGALGDVSRQTDLAAVAIMFSAMVDFWSTERDGRQGGLLRPRVIAILGRVARAANHPTAPTVLGVSGMRTNSRGFIVGGF